MFSKGCQISVITVLADTQALATLPERELTSGWAEVVKYGLILDKEFFEFLESNAERLIKLEQDVVSKAITHSATLKAQVVSQDEKEKGQRIILNYGHTIAHGLEAATQYGHFLHGEAVAIGMVGAARLSQRLGILSPKVVKRQQSLLQKFGLPTIFSGVNVARIAKAIEVDKKTRAKKIRWVLLEDIGRTAIRAIVPQRDILAVLEELSQRSGVSKGMLSQIEQEKVNPTVAVVWKIAHGLGVPFHDLLADDNVPIFDLIRQKDTVILERDNGRCVFRIISPMSMAEKMELYMLQLKEKGVLASEPHAIGTEEFITRNGEFAVNIALIEKDKPILGVIFAPAKGLMYFAKKDEGAYRLENLQFKNKPNLDNAHRLPLSGKQRTLRVVVSRSHNLKETRKCIEKLKSFYPEIATVSVGSSIKFCLIAEGSADIYFRLGRTMEWDTAAGQIIIEEAGGKIVEIGSKKVLKYNKKTLCNGPFVAYRDKRPEISRLINLFWEDQKESQYN